MSTRGTYTIKSKTWNDKTKEQHFYIHYDNYPEGTAEYFKLFLEYENKRGGSICQFLRAISLAEFTDNPKSHGDTEYHYTLEVDGTLNAYKINRNWEDDNKTTHQIFFTGNLAEFLNKYLEPIKDDYTGRTIPHDYRVFKGEVMTTQQLRNKYTEEIKQNWHWLYSGSVGNASFRKAWEIHKELNPTDTGTPKELILASEVLARAYKWASADDYLNSIIKNKERTKV